MLKRWECSLLLISALSLVAGTAFAQVTIQSHGADVPEQKVQVLFETTCHVVAEEFHLPAHSFNDFRVTLVLDDSEERVTGDELTQAYMIYMKRWDEVQFATSASRLALHHLVSRERKARMVQEILRRSEAIAPVSAASLHAKALH